MDEKNAKFKSILSEWEKRGLSFKGKKLIVNTFVLPVISYLTEIYTEHIPENFVKETKQLLCHFLWGKTIWRVAYKTMSLRKEHGGMQLLNLANFITSKKIQWLIKINFSPLSKWNVIGKHLLSRLDNVYGIQNFIMSCTTFQKKFLKTPLFFTENA